VLDLAEIGMWIITDTSLCIEVINVGCDLSACGVLAAREHAVGMGEKGLLEGVHLLGFTDGDFILRGPEGKTERELASVYMSGYDPYLVASSAIHEIEKARASIIRKVECNGYRMNKPPSREGWGLTDESLMPKKGAWNLIEAYQHEGLVVTNFHQLFYKGVTVTSNLEVLKKFNLIELRAILTLFYIQQPELVSRAGLNMAIHFVEECMKAGSDDVNNHADLIREINELKEANGRLRAQISAIKSAFD
jgi:hypothetical protein